MALLNWSHVQAHRSYLYWVSALLFIGLVLSVYSVVYVILFCMLCMRHFTLLSPTFFLGLLSTAVLVVDGHIVKAKNNKAC